MADAARYYFWAVFAISSLDACLRLSMTNRLAELQCEKLAISTARNKRTWIGLAAIVLSPLILLYGFWGHIRGWMWLSVLYGVIAGMEQLTSVHAAQRNRMTGQVRTFGLISAAMAAAVYFIFLRK